MRFTVNANIDSRTSLTGIFLGASAIFAKRAFEIEAENPSAIGEDLKLEHRGLVLAAIMQSVASLEAEIYEVVEHGPGHYLGSNGTDADAQKFLKPMAAAIDSMKTLTRYDLVLHLLNKEPLPHGNALWAHTHLLIKLRNSVVHYKSEFNQKIERKDILKSLRYLDHNKPSFVPEHAPFFPHQLLSAECAGWAACTALSFLNAFYSNLGFPRRFKYLDEKFANVLPEKVLKNSKDEKK